MESNKFRKVRTIVYPRAIAMLYRQQPFLRYPQQQQVPALLSSESPCSVALVLVLSVVQNLFRRRGSGRSLENLPEESKYHIVAIQLKKLIMQTP